jgi:hypothetical protein
VDLGRDAEIIETHSRNTVKRDGKDRWLDIVEIRWILSVNGSDYANVDYGPELPYPDGAVLLHPPTSRYDYAHYI